MRVSEEYLARLCRQAEYELKHHNDSLCLRDALALDLRDARARITELENPGRTQFCLGCEQHARKVADLEAQLTEARKDGERYRHIRTEPIQYVYDNYRERFDAAIDAAAAAAEREKE
ncbi:MAG: hypothetical protein ACK5X3_15205 [Pseudomonadota bacterium]|jgi:hypothetical protein